MAMDDLDLFTDDDVPEDGEKGEHRRQSRLAINDEERYMVNLKTIGQVSNPSPSFICVCDDNDFVAAVYEFLGFDEYCYQRIEGALEPVQLTIDRCDFQFRLSKISPYHGSTFKSENLPGWGKKKSLTILSNSSVFEPLLRMRRTHAMLYGMMAVALAQ